MDPVVFNINTHTVTTDNLELEIALSKHIGFPKKDKPHLQCDTIGITGGDDFILIAVADGMGARVGSEEASKIAMEEVEAFTCEPGGCSGSTTMSIEDRLSFDSEKEWMERRNYLTFEEQCTLFPEMQIFKRASERIQSISEGNTTLLLALYFEHEGKLYRRVSHVGDSRFYSRQNGKDLQQITKDHGFLQMVRDDILDPKSSNPFYVDSGEELTELGHDAIVDFLEKEGEGYVQINGGWYQRPFEAARSNVQRNVDMLTRTGSYVPERADTVDIYASEVKSGDVDMGCSDGVYGPIDQSDYVKNGRGIWIKTPTGMDDSLKRGEGRVDEEWKPAERYCGQLMEDAYNIQNANGAGDNMACFTVCVK
jgi:hypothetical protein